jgi:hypothetical protein
MAETSIKATSDTTGTGNITINEDVSNVLQIGDVVDLTIINRRKYYDSEYIDFTEWENSKGRYLGEFVFSRDEVDFSSANNALVNFSAGTKTISIKLPITLSLSAYQTIAGLAANVATLTANNATNLSGAAASAYQTIAGLAANVATLTANNATNLSGAAASAYQTIAGLAANVAVLRVYQSYTATEGQTIFAVANGYSNDKIDVFYNGVHLANTEYTAANGTHFVLTEAANVSAIVEVVG